MVACCPEPFRCKLVELVNKSRILVVSITELLDYMRCRRAWDFQSANRQSLVRKGIPATALWVGQAMHLAFAAQIDGKDWEVALDEYISAMRAEMTEDYQRRVGAPMSTSEVQLFQESVTMIKTVVRRYFLYYGTPNTFASRGCRAIASELTFRIPLPKIAAKYGYDMVYLVGTIDAVLQMLIGNDIGLADHKSFTQRVDIRDLKYDHQFVGYAACMYVLTGIAPRFFLYNGVNKKIPTVPPVLKGQGPTQGRLSRSKENVTDFVTYREAIVANNEDPDDPFYAEHLAWLALRDKEDSPFFVRHRVDFSVTQLKDWWDNAMTAISEIAGDPPIYYNRRWEGCWDCNVRDLCDTMSTGGDVQYLIQTGYQIGTYGTQQTLQNTVSPETVNSVEDLLNFTKIKQELRDHPLHLVEVEGTGSSDT